VNFSDGEPYNAAAVDPDIIRFTNPATCLSSARPPPIRLHLHYDRTGPLYPSSPTQEPDAGFATEFAGPLATIVAPPVNCKKMDSGGHHCARDRRRPFELQSLKCQRGDRDDRHKNYWAGRLSRRHQVRSPGHGNGDLPGLSDGPVPNWPHSRTPRPTRKFLANKISYYAEPLWDTTGRPQHAARVRRSPTKSFREAVTAGHQFPNGRHPRLERRRTRRLELVRTTPVGLAFARGQIDSPEHRQGKAARRRG